MVCLACWSAILMRRATSCPPAGGRPPPTGTGVSSLGRRPSAAPGRSPMSRAFVKESDDHDTEALPDRLISPHPNFVTRRGLDLLEARRHELEAARAEARANEDTAA